jgi:hypothetical protein
MPSLLWPNLTPLSVLGLLCIGASIYLIGSAIYSTTSSPLAKIPGPFWGSVSRTWIMWQTMRGDIEKTQLVLHKKHGKTLFEYGIEWSAKLTARSGKLVRIAPNEISISDPAAIKTIYAVKSTFFKVHSDRPPGTA